MTPEKLESMTIENAKCISSLTEIAKNTSSDVDKLVTHMDRVLTITEQMKSLHKRVDSVEDVVKWLVRLSAVTMITIIGYLINKFIVG